MSVPRKPTGKTLQNITLGGTFDETAVTLEVYSKNLDRHEVTRLLEVQPTKAWNPGESHFLGKGKSGQTRIVDWGKWWLRIEYDESPAADKIRTLLDRCTESLQNWRILAEKYDVRLKISGEMMNWNRELDLPTDVLQQIVERGVQLTFDVYCYCDGEDEPETP